MLRVAVAVLLVGSTGCGRLGFDSLGDGNGSAVDDGRAVDDAAPIPGTYDRWIMGGHHACGLTGGRWRCMGWNQDGQLGVGTTTSMGELVDLCP